MEITINPDTLQEFFNSESAKKRMNSISVEYLTRIMKRNPGIPMESIFLDFLRHFNSVALIPRKKKSDSEKFEVVSYYQIQNIFTDLLLARKCVEQEEFDDWMNAPAYEKESLDDENT